MKKILNIDNAVERHTVVHGDADGNIVLETKQDVSKIIDGNKQLFNQTKAHDKYSDMTHVARIPLTVIDDLNRKGIMRGFAVINEPAMKSFLNDPDNRFFRTRAGVV